MSLRKLLLFVFCSWLCTSVVKRWHILTKGNSCTVALVLATAMSCCWIPTVKAFTVWNSSFSNFVQWFLVWCFKKSNYPRSQSYHGSKWNNQWKQLSCCYIMIHMQHYWLEQTILFDLSTLVFWLERKWERCKFLIKIYAWTHDSCPAPDQAGEPEAKQRKKIKKTLLF